MKIQKLFLIDREIRKFNIVIIQKQDCNINHLQSFNAAYNFFYLVKNLLFQSRICIYVNKHLKLNQWVAEIIESNICLIIILICNTDDETQMLQLLNIYNLCSLFYTFTEEFSIIPRMNELLNDDCEQLIVEDFNLHHSHWEKRKCYTQHTAINILLNIIINAKLKLLLKSDTVTCKTYNQFTTINLVFSSKKVQFMICKCKIHINLHQKSDYVLIITEICLQTISVQLTIH